jgi:hypothetical protein
MRDEKAGSGYKILLFYAQFGVGCRLDMHLSEIISNGA